MINDKSDFHKDYVDIKSEPRSIKSSKPIIAGFLLIIAGILAILYWILISTIEVTNLIDFSQLKNIYPELTIEQIETTLSTCAIIGYFIAVITILGGIFAIKRKMWKVALIGGIIGLLTFGPILISSILSLIGVILIIISRVEFQ
jgi:hypothetical protein